MGQNDSRKTLQALFEEEKYDYITFHASNVIMHKEELTKKLL